MELYLSGELDETQKNKRPIYVNFEYDFQNFAQYAISSLCYCLTGTAYIYFDQSESSTPIVLTIVTSVFVCLPIYYMELFLGRYTQNSILHLKYMVPVARGLPYITILVTILYTIGSGHDLTDTVLYLLMCFQRELPWAVCPKNTTKFCYYKEKPKNCTTDKCVHSAMAYWNNIFMENPAIDMKNVRLGLPIVHRFVSSCICWAFIFLLTATAYKQRHKCLSVMFYIHCASTLILFVVVLINVGATSELPTIFSIGSKYYFDADQWAEALTKGIKLFKLGHAHHVLAGARLPSDAPIGLWCVYFWMILMTLAMFCTMFVTAIIGVQKYSTGGDVDAMNSLHLFFVVKIPGGLTYTDPSVKYTSMTAPNVEETLPPINYVGYLTNPQETFTKNPYYTSPSDLHVVENKPDYSITETRNVQNEMSLSNDKSENVQYPTPNTLYNVPQTNLNGFENEPGYKNEIGFIGHNNFREEPKSYLGYQNDLYSEGSFDSALNRHTESNQNNLEEKNGNVNAISLRENPVQDGSRFLDNMDQYGRYLRSSNHNRGGVFSKKAKHKR
ncbi:uncharacterized protein [Onthophagus taurus]|uniref:uncharacterized protein isoform X2 n=1 Tax=Onthophagus taurus TaxID=166361 RepID=UPI0039BEA30A